MSAATHSDWPTSNRRYLATALDALRRILELHATGAAGDSGTAQATQPPAQIMPAVADAMASPPALEQLAEIFGLSTFERDILLLCAAVELDATFAPLCASAQGNPQRGYPTFSLALAALPNADWSALAPDAPLRRWRLIEVGAGNTLTRSPLRIDERVLHELVGVRQLDSQLAALLEPLENVADLPPAQSAVAEQIAATWVGSAGPTPAIQLVGGDQANRRIVATTACASLGLKLYALAARDIPASAADMERLARLWEREAAISGSALLIECDDTLVGATMDADASRDHSLDRLIGMIGGPLLVAGGPRRRSVRRPIRVFGVPAPTDADQRAVWHAALGKATPALNGHLELLAAQFRLGALAIQSVCVETLGAHTRAVGDATEAVDELADALWHACRAESRQHMDGLAQRIEPAASWDELVLPEAQRRVLREIALHLRQRDQVYQQWGFATKGVRGLGISALFAGGSGTGKTMAAEVLADELRLDLYRIDLSAVVSKYIGETEKNLKRVFDAAEISGAILLFDEADALFGKRSEVKDSHDRYANIEVSYLLQRMETYRGLAILTTNMKDSLDPAFLRRIRFVVQFPFPDAEQRAEIWRRVFPAATPTEGLDTAKLARLSVAGGNIRNIALHAAFLAADETAPVRMAHLLRAAHSECAKLEKPLTAGEIRDWV